MSVKFKAVAWPAPPKPKDYKDQVRVTLPDQSLSLEDILDRFTRNESVPVGKHVQFDSEAELDSAMTVDIEKIMRADLVERANYFDMLENVKKTFEKEEKARQKKTAEAELEKRIKAELAAREAVAKQNSEQSAK